MLWDFYLRAKFVIIIESPKLPHAVAIFLAFRAVLISHFHAWESLHIIIYYLWISRICQPVSRCMHLTVSLFAGVNYLPASSSAGVTVRQCHCVTVSRRHHACMWRYHFWRDNRLPVMPPSAGVTLRWRRSPSATISGIPSGIPLGDTLRGYPSGIPLGYSCVRNIIEHYDKLILFKQQRLFCGPVAKLEF